MILVVPTTSLRLPECDERIKGIVLTDAKSLWDVYYVRAGIRPVVRNDEAREEIFLVLSALRLDIPEIEVWVNDVSRDTADLAEKIRYGGTIDALDVANMELREIRTFAPSGGRRRGRKRR